MTQKVRVAHWRVSPYLSYSHLSGGVAERFKAPVLKTGRG